MQRKDEMSAIELRTPEERKAASEVLDALKLLPEDRRASFLNERINEIRTNLDHSVLGKIHGHFQIDGLTDEEKLKQLRDRRRRLNDRSRDIKKQITALGDERAVLQRKLNAWSEVEILGTTDFKFSQPQTSRFYHLLKAFADKLVIMPNDHHEACDSLHLEDAQIILVAHDLASAFENASDFDYGEFRLPFPVTCFEFDIQSAMRVCAIFLEADGNATEYAIFLETSEGWAFSGFPEKNDKLNCICAPIAEAVRKQARAVCIALDAEVAETAIVRAPHKLNLARERRGNLPINDYHVIQLSRKSRPLPLDRTGDGEPKYRKRLHFRRGHWRHYETHKTWIKWTLVGNPDLGFIDKHYRM